MIAFLSKIDRTRLALGGIALAAVLFLSVNIFAGLTLRSGQIDLTERNLFTLSDGTRKVISGLDEPVTLRLYYTRALGDSFPDYGAYQARVREFLERYASLADGKINLEFYDPEPFSKDEDAAVTFGLRGVPINQAGDHGYFGVAGTNVVDGQSVVPFLSPDREPFLEYDLTKLVFDLSQFDKPVVGMLSSLPIEGGFAQGQAPQPAWVVADQIRELFDIRTLPAQIDAVPEEVDVLMLVHPRGLTPDTLYAIDQYMLRGGQALVFVDAHAELEAPAPGRPPGPSELDDLLKAWGVDLVDGKVAGDLMTARRVSVRFQGQVTAADYVAWNELDRRFMATEDAVIGDISALNIGSAGILEPIDGSGLTVTPLLKTSVQSQAIDVAKLKGRIDVVGLFRDFVPSNKALTIAARVSGIAKTSFPGGAPSAAGAGSIGEHLVQASKPINAIIVADTDFLHEGLWADISDIGGEKVVLPYAHNAAFVVNALENLTGGEALLGLRSRSDSRRPFDRVEEIRLEAERSFRNKQQALIQKLNETQQQLDQLTSREQLGGEAILSPRDRLTTDRFRRELGKIRRELREVQHALRKDIETLDSWLKFLNIAAIPLFLALLTLAVTVVRRVRRRRALAA